MAVQGHSTVIDSLLTYLPPVSLFLGPYSVGRWTTAEYIRWRYAVESDDVLRVHDLDVEHVETIKQFTLTPPANSTFKLVIVELYKASQSAQVALTSALRSPHSTKIIVIGQEHEVQLAVRQHAVMYPFRYLTSEQVSKILVEKMNFSDDRADDLGARSGGQVANALTLANADETLTVVRAALHAIRSRDAEALAALATKWTDEATGYLLQWCNETLSQRWRVFEPEDYVAAYSLPLKILITLRARVRPRLVVRSQLMSILRGD